MAQRLKVNDTIDLDDQTIPLWIRVCAFIETLTIEHGALQGQPFQLQPFQVEIIKAICGDDYNLACLSMARGNGKTALLAAIVVAAVVGPLAVKNTEIPIVASDKAQAGICAEFALQYMEPWIKADPKRFRVRNNRDEGIRITDTYNQIVVKAVSANPSSKHGAGFALAICDEPAQWAVNSGQKVWSAFIGSRGKQKNSKVVAIGTLPDSEHHFFSKAIKLGLTEKGRTQAKTWAMLHAADEDAEYDDWEQTRKANPMLDHLPELEKVVRSEVKAIKLGEGSKAAFQAYRQNKGTMETDLTEYLLGDNTLHLWENTCVLPALEFNQKHPRDGDVFVGLDLGEARSLTAAVMYWYKTGRLEIYCGMPVNSQLTIEEREREDSNPGVYKAAIRNGELKAFAGQVTPVDQFLDWIANDILKGVTPKRVFADRYKQQLCTQALMNLNNGWHNIIEFRAAGSGEHGISDVTNFRREVFNGDLKSRPSFLMLAALRDARIRRDTNGNPSIDKSRSRARIDCIQAGVMAVGAGYREKYPDPNSTRDGSVESYVWV